MRRKKILALALAVTMASSMSMTAFAGSWEQDGIDYKYKNDDGTYATGTWQWIDGKSYYFDGNGYMLHDTVTPDGYQVNASGAWVVNGVVQTQATGSTGNVAHSGNYNPAHPLAGMVDEWNLRLADNGYNPNSEICSINVQAMLTNQMDKYYAVPAGESLDQYGDHIYISAEDYNSTSITRF